MNKISILAISLFTGSLAAHASPELKLETIKQIVCDSTVRYEEETPNDKTPTRGVKIFVPGSRKDVRPKAGAFLLSEFEDADAGGLKVFDDQQFYFEPIKDGKLVFTFIADWKANGELKLGADNTAMGFINQKTHITELSCAIILK